MVKTLEKTKIPSVVSDFFKQFSKWYGTSATTPTSTELAKYIADDLQVSNNGKLIAGSASEYLERIKKLQRNYTKFQISEALEEPLVSGNRAAIYYKLDLTTRTGQHKQVYVLGLVTIEDNKISQWVEVTSEKDATTWDA